MLTCNCFPQVFPYESLYSNEILKITFLFPIRVNFESLLVMEKYDHEVVLVFRTIGATHSDGSMIVDKILRPCIFLVPSQHASLDHEAWEFIYV